MLNITYQVACGNYSKKMFFDALLCNWDRLFISLLYITHDRLLFEFHSAEINRIRQVDNLMEIVIIHVQASGPVDSSFSFGGRQPGGGVQSFGGVGSI